MGITNDRVTMYEMETTTATTTSTWVTMVTKTIRVCPMFHLQIGSFSYGGCSMERVEDMLHKIMRRFDTSDEHINELRCDLASIGQKVDTHAISIKQIEVQVPTYLR